jgi:hypothetical protein
MRRPIPWLTAGLLGLIGVAVCFRARPRTALCTPAPAMAGERSLMLCRAHPREGVDHQADQRPIAQAGKGSGIDRIDQGLCFVGLQHRRLDAPLRVLRPAHGVGGIDG